MHDVPNPFVELDCAFDQNGAPVVAGIREDGNLSIWFFDVSAGGRVLEDFGAARTPRLMLDDPTNPSDSDIMCFFIAAGTIRYRLQSERYATEHDTTVAVTADQYLERLIRGQDRRVHLVLSTRDTETGTYSLERMSSNLYPYPADSEEMDLSFQALAGAVELVVIDDEMRSEDLDPQFSAADALLELIVVENQDDDEVDSSSSILSVTVEEVVVEYDAAAEALDPSFSAQAGLLEGVVIVYTDGSPEELDATFSAQSGVLETV